MNKIHMLRDTEAASGQRFMPVHDGPQARSLSVTSWSGKLAGEGGTCRATLTAVRVPPEAVQNSNYEDSSHDVLVSQVMRVEGSQAILIPFCAVEAVQNIF